MSLQERSHAELLKQVAKQSARILELEQREASLELQNKNLVDKTEDLTQKTESLTQQAEVLTELVRLLRGQKFGPKSEKGSPEQMALGECFDEAEASPEEGEETETIEVKSYKKKKPKRSKLPENLPRREEIIDLNDSEKCCDQCGEKLSEIGDVRSEKLDIEPMVIEIIERIRRKYACKSCESSVKTAPLPKDPIPKSIATPGLLSFITVNKYQDRLPLYAIEGILQRNGIDIGRNTLASWMIKSGQLIQPIINLLEENLLSSSYLKMDETPVQVLKEPGKKATSQSYMWLRWRAGPEPIVLFEYDPTRNKEVPIRLLEGFAGYLQVDGYGGYDKVCGLKEITRIGCMAHVRRKFKEAAKNMKKKAKANYALKLIGKLYAFEKKFKDKSDDEKYRLRLTHSKPVYDKFFEWAHEQRPRVAPKTLLGKALTYAINEKENVGRYLEQGFLDIDNNLIENAIRPFAVGRKNWLFSDSQAGARSSANLYSLIETAKANGLQPYAYLKHLFTELPKAETIEQIELLLPDHVAKHNFLA